MAGLFDRLERLPAGAMPQSTPTVAELRAAAVSLKATDMTAGGGAVLREAIGEARRATWLLDHRPSPEMAEAVGWLVSNAGFMAFDAGHTAQAETLWSVAMSAADESGNTSLQARVRGQMARQAIEAGRPLDALARIENTQALPGLTPREHAMLLSLSARAAALMGNVRGVDRAANEADAALADGGDVEDRPWVAHYDWPHQHGDIGSAYKTLVLAHGRPGVSDVTTRHEAAASGHPGSAARSQAMALAGLATVEVAQGDLELGLHTGHDAVAAAESIQSWRLTQRLRHLHGVLGVHTGSGVDELRHRVATAA